LKRSPWLAGDQPYRLRQPQAGQRDMLLVVDASLGPTRRLPLSLRDCAGLAPRLYTPDRGPPRLRGRHLPFAIDAAARDAWMDCMRRALAETCADAGLRAELEAAFASSPNPNLSIAVAGRRGPPQPPLAPL